jgi:hypothetical protein
MHFKQFPRCQSWGLILLEDSLRRNKQPGMGPLRMGTTGVLSIEGPVPYVSRVAPSGPILRGEMWLLSCLPAGCLGHDCLFLMFSLASFWLLLSEPDSYSKTLLSPTLSLCYTTGKSRAALAFVSSGVTRVNPAAPPVPSAPDGQGALSRGRLTISPGLQGVINLMQALEGNVLACQQGVSWR